MKKRSQKHYPYYSAWRQRTNVERLKIKRWLVDHLGGKCVDCGYNAHLAALDFDHVEPTEKRFTISSRIHAYDLSQLLLEAKKCVLRCANCHRIKTNPNATDNLEIK